MEIKAMRIVESQFSVIEEAEAVTNMASRHAYRQQSDNSNVV